MRIARCLSGGARLGLCGLAQVATITVRLEGATQTQAVLSYDTLDSSPCAVTVTEAATPSVVVHDVDRALFDGADQDLSRPFTIMNGTRRFVTIGARTSDVAKEGKLYPRHPFGAFLSGVVNSDVATGRKLYSRAWQAATDHVFSVTCAHAAGSLTFTTQNPPLGNLYPEVPPFNPAGFGNYAWPVVDGADPSKTYIDPMTGLLLKPAQIVNPQGFSGQWGNQPFEWHFADVFDLKQAWTGVANILTGSASGPFAAYSGSSSDPLYLPFPIFTNPDLAVAGWGDGHIWDDVRLTLYGSGSDPDPENRKVLVCLGVFYAPAANKCVGGEVELTLPANYPGAVATPNFPKLGFPAWTLGRFLTKDEASIPFGSVSVVNSVVTWKDGVYFPLSMPAGVKIKIGSQWFTVASAGNATQLTLSEPSVTVDGVAK